MSNGISIHCIVFPEVTCHFHTPKSVSVLISMCLLESIFWHGPWEDGCTCWRGETFTFLGSSSASWALQPLEGDLFYQVPSAFEWALIFSNSIVFVFSRILAKCTELNNKIGPSRFLYYLYKKNVLFRKGKTSIVFETVELPWEAKSCFTSLASSVHKVSSRLWF